MPEMFERMFHFWDDWIYLKYAKNILTQGLWVPDISQLDLIIYGREYNAHIVGPGYPLVISLIMNVFGDYLKPIMFFNVIISSLTCIVIFYLVKEVFTKEIGLVSSVWSITYVYFMVYIPRLMKDNMLQLFIPLVILLMIYEIKKDKANIKSIIFPSVFSFLIHTDERYTIFIPIIFISMILCNGSNKINPIKKFFVFFSILTILCVPWTIRNYQVYGKFIFLTVRTEKVTNTITKIFNYNEIDNSDTSIIEDNLNGKSNQKLSNKYLMDEKHNKFKIDSFKRIIKRFSIYWAPMVLRESTFDGYVIVPGSLKYNLGGMLTYGILLPFFLIGVIYSIKRNNLGFCLVIFIAIHCLLHIGTDLITPWPRYRYQIDSLIIIISFYGLSQLSNLIINKVINFLPVNLNN